MHNNCISTVCSASSSLHQLRQLETLQLANNQLQDLKGTLEVLSKLPFLKKLQLHSNPLASESMYREAVIFHIPTLTQAPVGIRPDRPHLFPERSLYLLNRLRFGSVE